MNPEFSSKGKIKVRVLEMYSLFNFSSYKAAIASFASIIDKNNTRYNIHGRPMMMLLLLPYEESHLPSSSMITLDGKTERDMLSCTYATALYFHIHFLHHSRQDDAL